MGNDAGKLTDDHNKALERSPRSNNTHSEVSNTKAFIPEKGWSSGSTNADGASSSTITSHEGYIDEEKDVQLAIFLSLQEQTTSATTHTDKGKDILQEDISSPEDKALHDKVMQCKFKFEEIVNSSAVSEAGDWEAIAPNVTEILKERGFSEGLIFKPREIQNNCQRWKFLKLCDNSNDLTLIDKRINGSTKVQLKRFVNKVIKEVEKQQNS